MNRTLFKRRPFEFLGCALLCCVLVFLFWTRYSTDTVDFAVMIDAGSSGTRIRAYYWSQAVAATRAAFHTRAAVQEVQLDINLCVSNIALSSFADEPELAGPAILPLVEYVKSVLSQRTDVSMVPLYLKATAGMRLLDGRVVTKIMDSVRKSFKSSGFFFQKLHARVISGEEEGVFGWLTVNFLHQSLGGSPNGTLGALEMGGASTQITFSPKDEILSSFFPLYMNRSLFPLYSHSHLGFGLNEFNRRFDAVVVQRAWAVSKQRLAVINNPCLPSGFMSTNTSVTPDPNHEPASVRFSGTFDFDICAELQLPLLQLDSPCFYPTRCSVQGVYLPALPKMRFHAFTNFADLFVEILQLPTGGTLSEIEDSLREVCSLPWPAFKLKYGKNRKLESIARFCSNGIFMLQLLLKAFHFPSDSVVIEFASSFHDTRQSFKYSWTLGAVLWEENLLPWTSATDLLKEASAHPILSLPSNRNMAPLWMCAGLLLGFLISKLLLHRKEEEHNQSL